MVRDFQSVIGNEIKTQMKKINNKTPDSVIACVGGGSNAIGTFYPLVESNAEIIGVEAAGKGLKSKQHSATLSAGSKGVLHGMMTYLLQDEEGQVTETHSISAGLDYPGVGPEHSYFKDSRRVKYHSATDTEVIDAFLDANKNRRNYTCARVCSCHRRSNQSCKKRKKNRINSRYTIRKRRQRRRGSPKLFE